MLKHNISTVQVFMTDQYKNFSMVTGNRGINQTKINKIIKEIERGNDMLEYYPIQVRVEGDRLEILDGQHRFMICKKLKRPVFYILVKEKKDMADIARVNSNVETWKAQDFINCYIQKKNKNYIRLQEFLNTYKINVGTSLRLLSHGSPGAEGGNDELKEKFEHGTFEILQWDEAVRIAELCKQFSGFEYWQDRGFIIAIYRIDQAGLVTIKELAAACLKYSDMLTKQMSQKQ
ncbi:MAG: hypothetical protein QM791_06105, partial [Ferruginibacter sp.]